jgi:prephenate dehydratase
MIIGYQGEIGCYSYNSIKKFFRYIPKAFKTFEEVFIALDEGKIDYGFIPIENTIGGKLYDNDKLIKKYKVEVIEKYNYKINHNLIVYPGVNKKDIEIVQSHWQALEQCKNYLKGNNYNINSFYDTSGSCKDIRDNDKKNIGAIASEEASKIYNLEILEKNIQDNDNNFTTFLLIQR